MLDEEFISLDALSKKQNTFYQKLLIDKLKHSRDKISEKIDDLEKQILHNKVPNH